MAAPEANASWPAGAGRFATTNWSMVLAARDAAQPQSRAALAELCSAYWYRPHRLATAHARQPAPTRGGGRPPLSLDFAAAENRSGHEPCHELTPERLYERRWVLALLDQVLGRLRDEQTRSGNGASFDVLKTYLTADAPAASYDQTSGQLGMSAAAIKVAVHRLRRRYRELLREEIGRTVDDPGDIDAEIRELFAALG
jgi:RNA polymerase sigma-70 factor (ECF subfamily)